MKSLSLLVSLCLVSMISAESMIPDSPFVLAQTNALAGELGTACSSDTDCDATNALCCIRVSATVAGVTASSTYCLQSSFAGASASAAGATTTYSKCGFSANVAYTFVAAMITFLLTLY